MGISHSSRHKRRKTGGKKPLVRKKRKYELGRQSAGTKIGDKKIKVVRVRGGNKKYRAIRIDKGNFVWKSEAIARKTTISDVVYNATSNELMRTKTLVKSAIVQIDAMPFKAWWENHYGEKAEDIADEKKLAAVHKFQMGHGYMYARITTRPGQTGFCDGYVLEGDELDFYLKKIKSKHH
ncbi:MAG: 40S ribosomal protein S8 [Amphiamblys sp. WSBS2006]|nr:MAG: 40S ribosomal protein S8 [Amphiamblys sp. WSBS2006]